MKDYQIAFVHAELNKLPVEIKCYQVIAEDELTALEGAFHTALAQNHDLAGANGVIVQLLVPLSQEMVDSFEKLRGLTAKLTASQTPPDCTLH